LGHRIETPTAFANDLISSGRIGLDQTSQPRDRWLHHDLAYYYWIFDRPALGLCVSGHLLRTIGPGPQRTALLQLHAALLADLVLSAPALSSGTRQSNLREASRTACQAIAESDLGSALYWRALRTLGVVELASGNLQRASRALFGAAMFTNDIEAQYHLGVLAMMGTVTYRRATHHMASLRRRLRDARHTRLGLRIDWCLETIRKARRAGFGMNEDLLLWYWAMPREIPASIVKRPDALHSARSARAFAFDVSFLDILYLARHKPTADSGSASSFEWRRNFISDSGDPEDRGLNRWLRHAAG
jgi:hypothetical protein